MIKYLGSKRALVPLIQAPRERGCRSLSACDLFAGTTRVGQALRRLGLDGALQRSRHLLGRARPGLHRRRRHASTGLRLARDPRRALGRSRAATATSARFSAAGRAISSLTTGAASTRSATRSSGYALRRSSGASCSPRCSRRPTGSTARPVCRWPTSRVGAALAQRARAAPARARSTGPAGQRQLPRRERRSPASSTSTSSTSTRPTTSTRSSPTTTSGRRSCAGTLPATYGVAAQAGRLPRAQERLQLARRRAGGARRADREPARALADRLGERRGLPLARSGDRASARRARRRVARIDVDAKRYVGRRSASTTPPENGRRRLASAKPRAPVPRRPRPRLVEAARRGGSGRRPRGRGEREDETA